MSINQMVAVFAAAQPNQRVFTVMPGWRAEQIAGYLSSLGLRGREFLHAVRHPAASGFHSVGARHSTLEGFLYPDTYKVDPNATGGELAAAMLRRFSQVFTPAMRRLAAREHRSIYRIVKMASIVEREAGNVRQMPLIASVYYNRLKLARGADGGVGKLLESDPTVSYALGHREGIWWPNISAYQAHHTLSPFNTYLHYGLPPAPIAEPDLHALRAALHPAHTRYYYFLSCAGSTKLLFQSTLAQHDQACQR